jgi:hypothetical protein
VNDFERQIDNPYRKGGNAEEDKDKEGHRLLVRF